MVNIKGKNTPKDATYKRKDWLTQKYINKNRTIKEIAEIANVSFSAIHYWIHKHKIQLRATGLILGQPKTRHRNGNRLINSQKYIIIYEPEHHRAAKSGFVLEHIVVAEKKIGRKLKYYGRNHSNNEIIHHIDGCRTNNSPDNLFITNNKNHRKLHYSLEKMAYELFRKGKIIFDNKKGLYH